MHRRDDDLGRRPAVWVISKSRLREFWQTPAHADSAGPLAAWYRHVSAANWTKSSDVKADFSYVDFVGNCAVFNVSGNKYRLVARILYQSHKVFILRVMTHKQYDEKSWVKDCGCHKQPPNKKRR
jgi:mRNA interferase HigB